MKHFKRVLIVIVLFVILATPPFEKIFINKCYAKYVYRYVKTVAIIRIN